MIGPDEAPQQRDERFRLLNDLNRNGTPDQLEARADDLGWDAVVGLVRHARALESAKGARDAPAAQDGGEAQAELTAARDRQAEFIRSKGISAAQLARFDELPDDVRDRLEAVVAQDVSDSGAAAAGGRWTVQRRDPVKGLYFDEYTTNDAVAANETFQRAPEYRVIDNVIRDVAADYEPHYAGHDAPRPGQEPVSWQAEYSKRSTFEGAIVEQERRERAEQLDERWEESRALLPSAAEARAMNANAAAFNAEMQRSGDTARAEAVGVAAERAHELQEARACQQRVEAYRSARDGSPEAKRDAAREHPELVSAFALEAAARVFAKDNLAPTSVTAFIDRTRANIERDLAEGKAMVEMRYTAERHQDRSR